MKIAFLHRDLPPDSYTGVAIQVHRLANALTRLGEDVTVFSMSKKSDDAQYFVVTLSFGWLKRLNQWLPFLKRIWHPIGFRKIDFSGFEVVHVHGDGAFLKWDRRYVRTFYGAAQLESQFSPHFKGRLAQKLSALFEQHEMKSCLHTVAIAPHIQKCLAGIQQIIPCMLPSVTIIPTLLKKKAHCLLYIGSRGTRKRGELALNLFKSLRQKFPDLHLHYVTHEKEALDLRNHQNSPGLTLHTKVSSQKLQQLYSECILLLSVASYEGFGVPIIEAFSQDCLPLCTPHFGAIDLLLPEFPELVSAVDSLELSASRLLMDEALRTSLAKKGKQFAHSFSSEKIAASYQHLYHEVISKTTNPMRERQVC